MTFSLSLQTVTINLINYIIMLNSTFKLMGRLVAVLLAVWLIPGQANAAKVWYEYKGAYVDEQQHITYACYYDTERGMNVAEIRGGRHEESDQYSGNPDVVGNLVIPDHVEYQGVQYAVDLIREYAFENCLISSVKFPSTLTTIENGAFKGCENLKTLTIPDNVEVIENYVFAECTRLRTVYIGSGITCLGMYHPSGYSSNSISAFRNCPRVTDVYITADPDKLQWNYCYDRSLTVLSPYTDSEEFKANAATRCHVKGNLAKWQEACSHVNVTFVDNWDDPVAPELIASGDSNDDVRWEVRRTDEGADTYMLDIIGTGAIPDYSYISGTSDFNTPWYQYKDKITEVEIEEGVTRIGEYAFANLRYIKSLCLPYSLKTIGYNAFSQNSALKNVNLLSYTQLETVEGGAFESCYSLQSLTLPASLKSVKGNVVGYTDAYVRVAEANPTYYNEGNCVIERATKTLVVGNKYSVIPSDVVAIGDYAFWGSSIQSVSFPASLKTIGAMAFTACDLKELSLPEGLESIGNWTFQSCSQLKTVSIYAGLKSLGVCAFQNCRNVTDVYCYADPKEMQWLQYTDRRNFNPGNTKMHVLENLYEDWVAKYSDACVIFVGDQTDEDAKNVWTKARNKDWPTYYNGESYETKTTFGIESAEDLAQLAYLVNVEGLTFEGKTIEINKWADIDLSAHEWVPIGGYVDGTARYFKGTFTGSSSYNISGLRINATGTKQADVCKGLFGMTKGATIEKVNLTNSLIIGNNQTGGIVGEASEGTVIRNCHVDETVIVRAVAASPESEKYYCVNHGGIVGNLFHATVEGCTSKATVDMNSTDVSGYFRFAQFGGIVGNNEGTVKYCLAVGAKVKGLYNVGVIAGVKNENAAGTSGIMSHNYYTPDCSSTHYDNEFVQKSGAGIGVGYISENGGFGRSGFYDVLADDGAQMSAGSETSPSYIGNYIEDYGRMYAYENGLYYRNYPDYLYYFVERPEIATMTEEVVVNTDKLETEETLENVEVDNVYYNLSSEGGSGYDSTDGSIVIAESTDMDEISDGEPGSADVREHFNGIIIRVAKGTGKISVKVKTTGGAKLAMKVGDYPATIFEQTEEGIVEKPYDVLEDTYLYIYAVDVASAAPSRGRLAPATSGVEISEMKVTPESSSIPTAQQTMTYRDGWQWISSYLRESIPITKYWDYYYDSYYTLKSYATRILSQTQELFYDPTWNQLVGNMDSFEPGRSYKVYIKKEEWMDDDFMFNDNWYYIRTGRSKYDDFHKYSMVAAPIHANKGWTWIAYPNDVEGTFADVLKNAEAGDVVTGQDGYAEFNGTNWEGSISSFVPGKGYIYKSVSDKDLELDFSAIAASARAAAKTPDAVPAMRKYPNTMNITARIVIDGQDQQASNFRILAIAPDGELRGQSKHVGQNHYLTVYGDDTVDITLVVENTLTGETLATDQTVAFEEGLLGSRMEPLAVSATTITAIDGVADRGNVRNVYDLQGRRINGNAMQKGVYLINGKKVAVK